MDMIWMIDHLKVDEGSMQFNGEHIVEWRKGKKRKEPKGKGEEGKERKERVGEWLSVRGCERVREWRMRVWSWSVSVSVSENGTTNTVASFAKQIDETSAEVPEFYLDITAVQWDSLKAGSCPCSIWTKYHDATGPFDAGLDHRSVQKQLWLQSFGALSRISRGLGPFCVGL